jgi:endonuclease YncB( thermonuclease family)
MKKTLGIVIFMFSTVLACGAGTLERLDGATLVDNRWNDGDSFRISHAGKELVIRLYYVDCPETRVSSASDASRVREQTRHFGLGSHDRTVHYGREAAAFTRNRLRGSFTVHTAYAAAQGRSKANRYYAFVTDDAGEDLGHLLVKHGYARSHGIGRALPDGITRNEAAAQLSDLELASMLDRRGIWEEAESDRLVELRAAARKDLEELAQIEREASKRHGKINVNTASAEELETIRGVGPTTAQRIIERRPITSPKDLATIPRLPNSTLTNILNQITFE